MIETETKQNKWEREREMKRIQGKFWIVNEEGREREDEEKKGKRIESETKYFSMEYFKTKTKTVTEKTKLKHKQKTIQTFKNVKLS